MGSRVYRLDTKTSDVDLYLECPADVSDCADIILHVLARLAGSGLARHGYKDGPALQESNLIAKWTDAKTCIDVSFSFARAAVVQRAFVPTERLSHFFQGAD